MSWLVGMVVAHLVWVTLPGCGPEASVGSLAASAFPEPGQSNRGVRQERPIVILTAASTMDAMQDIARLFEEQTGITVRVSPGPSHALAQQILAGAPADLYLSAHHKWADVIADNGQVLNSTPLLTNALVIVVPQGNPAGIQAPSDLLSKRVFKVALAGENVPAGLYAAQALRSLGLHRLLADASRIVRGPDVRAALNYVERGEVEAGIVYQSDARIAPHVEVAHTFPAHTHNPILYPVLLLKYAERKPAARQFWEFLHSEPAQDIFQAHGFTCLKRTAGAERRKDL